MKRTHESETTTTATNKRCRRPAGNNTAMFLELYEEEAMSEAEENISCRPAVFNDRYISVFEKWRDLLEDGVPGAERIASLVSRNRELNELARSAWKKRYEEMQAVFDPLTLCPPVRFRSVPESDDLRRPTRRAPLAHHRATGTDRAAAGLARPPDGVPLPRSPRTSALESSGRWHFRPYCDSCFCVSATRASRTMMTG
jgi:hypothetical protein